MITNEALNEYKRIYYEQNGIHLSDQEALEQATKLLRLIEIVYKPIPNKKDL